MAGNLHERQNSQALKILSDNPDLKKTHQDFMKRGQTLDAQHFLNTVTIAQALARGEVVESQDGTLIFSSQSGD
jgi:hypothetical protein